jgi:hypothetical protein
MTELKPIDELVERLTGEPQNVANQLRAMTEISDDARQMHRFDPYLLAGSNIIESQASLICEAIEVLGRIATAPAWGAPECFEPTPTEVRRLAQDTYAKLKGES